MIAIKEQDNTFYVKGNDKFEEKTTLNVNEFVTFFSDAYNFIKGIIGKIFNFLKLTVITIFAVLLALILIFCLIKCFSFNYKNKHRDINVIYNSENPEQVISSIH